MAGLNARLEEIATPDGSEFPGSVDGLLRMIAAYVKVVGLENYNGVNFGVNEPGADSRDKPWFRVDANGQAVGWYAWNGSGWSLLALRNDSGGSAERPASPNEGQQFFDTDIGVMLIFTRGKWRTLSGSTGDTKEVKAETLAAALASNPGWSHDVDSVGRVVAGADPDFDAIDEATNGKRFLSNPVGRALGEEEHMMDVSEVPDHMHLLVSNGSSQTGWNPPNESNPFVSRVGASGGNWQYQLGGQSLQPTLGRSSGVVDVQGVAVEQEAFNVMQPTIYYWRLVKD